MPLLGLRTDGSDEKKTNRTGAESGVAESIKESCTMARYDVNNIAVSSLLSSIKDGSIAIPEIQRPFVWDSTKGWFERG